MARLAQLVVHEERDVLGRAAGQVDEVLKRGVQRVLERLLAVEGRRDQPARPPAFGARLTGVG